jgi:hypothetical protein
MWKLGLVDLIKIKDVRNKWRVRILRTERESGRTCFYWYRDDDCQKPYKLLYMNENDMSTRIKPYDSPSGTSIWKSRKNRSLQVVGEFERIGK